MTTSVRPALDVTPLPAARGPLSAALLEPGHLLNALERQLVLV